MAQLVPGSFLGPFESGLGVGHGEEPTRRICYHRLLVNSPPLPRLAAMAVLAISSLFPPENYPYALLPLALVVGVGVALTRCMPPARPLWPLVGLWLWSAVGLAWTLSTTRPWAP